MKGNKIMNPTEIVDVKKIKSMAALRMSQFASHETLNTQEESNLIESAQTLLFLSLLENKDQTEISRNREICADLYEKLGLTTSSIA